MRTPHKCEARGSRLGKLKWIAIEVLRMSRTLVIVHSSKVQPKILGKGVASRRLITGPKDGSHRFMVSLLHLDPGSLTEGVYEDKDEALYLLNGQLTFQWDDGHALAGPGDAVFIPMGTRVEMNNSGPEAAELVAVIAPSKTLSEL